MCRRESGLFFNPQLGLQFDQCVCHQVLAKTATGNHRQVLNLHFHRPTYPKSVTLLSCKYFILQSPFKNHSSSWMMERKAIFLCHGKESLLED